MQDEDFQSKRPRIKTIVRRRRVGGWAMGMGPRGQEVSRDTVYDWVLPQIRKYLLPLSRFALVSEM